MVCQDGGCRLPDRQQDYVRLGRPHRALTPATVGNSACEILSAAFAGSERVQLKRTRARIVPVVARPARRYRPGLPGEDAIWRAEIVGNVGSGERNGATWRAASSVVSPGKDSTQARSEVGSAKSW